MTQPPIYPVVIKDIQRPIVSTLANGMKMEVMNIANSPLVRLDFLFHTGKWQQDKPLQAYVTLDQMKEATCDMDHERVAKMLDFYGANVSTSSTYGYSVLTVTCLSKFLTEILQLVRDFLIVPLFDEQLLKLQMMQDKQVFEIQEQKVDIQCQKLFNRKFFGNQHPMARYAVADDYDHLCTDDLKSYHRRFIHSGNCSVWITGNTTDKIIERVAVVFGDRPWGGCEQVNNTPQPHGLALQNRGKRFSMDMPHAVQTAVRIGMIFPETHSDDYLPALFMATLLGGYFGSRLMSNIRERKGWTYGIQIVPTSTPFENVMSVITQTDNKYVEKLIPEVWSEVDRLKRELVGEDELQRVKNYLVGQLCRNLELGFNLPYLLMDFTDKKLTLDDVMRQADDIRNITPEMVRDMARKHLVENQAVVCTAGKNSMIS